MVNKNFSYFFVIDVEIIFYLGVQVDNKSALVHV